MLAVIKSVDKSDKGAGKVTKSAAKKVSPTLYVKRSSTNSSAGLPRNRCSNNFWCTRQGDDAMTVAFLAVA